MLVIMVITVNSIIFDFLHLKICSVFIQYECSYPVYQMYDLAEAEDLGLGQSNLA